MPNEPATTTNLTLPRIEMQPIEPPTPEEIERRRVLFARVMALRDEIGPIGISTSELIRQVREEADGDS
ncbi:MAG: hypothetical protein QOF01_1286 [Thermomicrobiales bacterium]|nr:hypothetical protein [Thermomicrobiales bacterium]